MNTSKRIRQLFIILCGITFWSTAVIANTNEEKTSNVIMLWPKDVATQDGTGMGTPKPDRGDGHIRRTNVTKPSIRYLPVPATRGLDPGSLYVPGEDTAISSQPRWRRFPNGSINVEFLPVS